MRERTADMINDGPSTECIEQCNGTAFMAGLLVGVPVVVLLVALVRVLVWPLLT